MGTTLEILAPYLPYGIEVETGVGRCRIMALDFTDADCELEVMTVEDCENGEGSMEYYDYANVTPILRSFEDLCTPLEDGTVPAIEAFKMLPFEEDIDWSKATARIEEPAPHSRPGHKVLHLFAPVVGEDGGYILAMTNHWTISGAEHTSWPRLFLKALHAQHVAVGLTPDQFIRKS